MNSLVCLCLHEKGVSNIKHLLLLWFVLTSRGLGFCDHANDVIETTGLRRMRWCSYSSQYFEKGSSAVSLAFAVLVSRCQWKAIFLVSTYPYASLQFVHAQLSSQQLQHTHEIT